MRRIGIFSGSFDPIHLGHLRIMRDVLDRAIVDEVLIVPSGAAPYRKPLVDTAHLRNMAAIAVKSLPQVSIASEGILKRGGNTVDTLRAILRTDPEAQYAYIIGADKLAGILHWREVDRLFKLCGIIVYPRTGYNAQELCGLAAAHGARVQFLAVPPVHMSSSLARAQIGQLSDAGDMILPEVAKYIALQGLYQPAYEKRVRQQMTQRRFVHTLGVRELAVELSFHHHLPMQKAAVAALLHDSAKCMKLGQLQAIAKQYQLAADAQTLRSNALLHGKVGAVLAQAKYGVHDEDVLKAIAYHTTGRAQMSPLELCIYVADAAEKNRADYPRLQEIREAMWVDLREAALISMQGTRDYVEASGQGYSEDTQLAINDLCGILHPKQARPQPQINFEEVP
ncbi:MAG: bis(5'-nucleosyl)-tetraphosphatase (symmetrical) YqeK [Christensenellales bacterium]